MAETDDVVHVAVDTGADADPEQGGSHGEEKEDTVNDADADAADDFTPTFNNSKEEVKKDPDEPTEEELVIIWAAEDPQDCADVMKAKFRHRGCPTDANIENMRKFLDGLPEAVDYLKPYLKLRNLIAESHLPFLQYLAQELNIKVEGRLVSHVWRNLVQKMRTKSQDAGELQALYDHWWAEKTKPIDWVWWGKVAALVVACLMAVFWTTYHFEESYTYWVLPVLFIQLILISIALFVGNPYLRQVMLGMIGLHWCFMALWVNTLIGIWYRDTFNYMDPPDLMKKYNPFCDIAAWAKCSRVFMSPHFHLLRQIGLVAEGGWMDWSNPSVGVMYYLSQIFYQVLRWIELPGMHIFSFGSASMVGAYSVWLVYVVIFLIGDFCIGCFVLCAVNISLIYTSNEIVNKETEEAEKSTFGRFKYD